MRGGQRGRGLHRGPRADILGDEPRRAVALGIKFKVNVARVPALQVVLADIHAEHRRGRRRRLATRAAAGGLLRAVVVATFAGAVVQSRAQRREPRAHLRIRPEPVTGSRTRRPARGGREDPEGTERDVIVLVRQERREVLRRRVHVPVGAVVQDDVRRLEDPEARRQGKRLASRVLQLEVRSWLDVLLEELVEVVQHRDPVVKVTLFWDGRR